ncbi:glutaredoxin domain-containing protein [Burkholderia sp. L27(2015)]|jgi:glutaredoxin|uniref:glutaredoxin domain-containing protein n=1 Tax=Burkholderia sp. L27(2015) TaxID=1641858 RepID=UPI00131B5C76|nr:glutaredoxin domain-containing protein [Burkholderia sp. L27(2015)]
MMLAADERIRVFWAPGCTSCLRVKEFLTRLEIDYESVNAASSAEHVEEMARLGARSVPIVSRGDAFVYAQSLADVASFLGLEVEVDRQLSPHELVRRVNIILPAGQRYIKQIPDDVLDVRFRNSVRLLRGIAHHVFRIVEAFVEAMETGVELSNELIMDATEAVRPGDDVLTYGSAVLAEFNAWWVRYPDKSCQAQMDTYFGRQSVHDVLERTTWHSAQHVRQLLLVLDTLGIAPDSPLTREDLAGLPLPEKVWEG